MAVIRASLVCLPAQVFIPIGELEGDSKVAKLTTFADSIRSHHYNGLSLTTQVFDNETHMTVIPGSISRTLTVLYGIHKK